MSIPPARSRARFGVLALISSLSALTYLDRTCISRVQNDIKTDLSFDDVQMGIVFGAFSVGYGLFEVPAGWMGDVWGARRVLTRIVLWWSLFTALTGSVGFLTYLGLYDVSLFTYRLPALFVLMVVVRFLFGCGEAGAYPNLARVVGTWFPFHERGLAQGAIWTCARLGGAVAPVLIGRLSRVVGWENAFWIFGLVGLVWCAGFYHWFRDTPAEMPACNQAEREWIRTSIPAQETASASHPPLSVGRLVRSPTMWALCTASVLVNFAWYFFPTWQPRYFDDVFGMSMEDSELLTGLPYLCGAVGAFIGGSLSDRLIRRTGSRRWGRALVGLAGFGGAGLCAFGIPFVTQAWQAVALLCLVFLINDLAVPVIWAATTDISGDYAGTVTAIVNTAGCIGAFGGPVLIGTLLGTASAEFSPHDQWIIIFTGLASAWILAGLSWFYIDASRPIS